MPVVVEVMPEAEFDAWYQDQVAAESARREALGKTFTPAELMVEGEQVYLTFCASCHQVDGRGLPPVFPALADSALVTGARDEHLRVVYEGVQGTAMQAFGRQLDAAQLAAVVHYERHAWGNNADDVTQPRDVIDLFSAQ